MNETNKWPVGKAIPEADYYEIPEQVDVFSWSPAPPGTSGKSTQVHLHFGTPGGTVMVVRLKSSRVVDQLIEALQLHRADVWGSK